MMRTLLSLQISVLGCFFQSETMAFAPAITLKNRHQHLANPLLKAVDSDSSECTRRDTLATILDTLLMAGAPTPALAKCTDIDSCREAGERKDQQNLKENPIYHLENGIDYKVLNKGSPSSNQKVSSDSSVDIAFSVSQANGRYMYSKGFGFEKVNFMGQMTPDRDIDSLQFTLGNKNVPIGIEQVLVGMSKGEKRRVVLPPEVGFDTSDWKPEPVKRDAQRQMQVYKELIRGEGGVPPLAAPTVWDVEVLSIRE